MSRRVIFCYGDSLTYGFPDPATPYSMYLERELNDLYDDEDDDDDDDSSSSSSSSKPTSETTRVVARHLGIPGYTARMMLDHINDDRTGLCPVIWRDRADRAISLVVILAGTNDIAMMEDTSTDVARSILRTIIDLHERAIECHGEDDGGGDGDDDGDDDDTRRLHTLAIGIPGSAYQNMVRAAADFATYINDGLRAFASSSSSSSSSPSNSRISYVDFPFPYNENGEEWNEDGLHLSEMGYQRLGRELAHRVKEILDGH
ncbi:hypothetical protein ACHAXA_005800 [Cyclostephanos tholiformis]|uniref:SGNH hydrolase-type esterase domain-containing protein n=1 Tax=Cyclostephanos tholiformis TaxID=382380 RepID=A0ABD3R9G9_9STRA